MSKYIDLEDTLLQSCHKAHDYPFVMDVKIVLAWLDNHPNQVPGRTITRSDYQKLVDDTSMPYGVGFTDGFHQAGGSITPDPEPTSAELLAGRTITESELIAAVDETNHEDMNEYQKARALLVHLGHTIPDPEPTNAEKLSDDLAKWTGDIETCVGLGLASWLADKGWEKAPGGDDDH